VITIHQRHRRTDGRTDGQTTCDRHTALCTEVHRAVKTFTPLIEINTGEQWVLKCPSPKSSQYQSRNYPMHSRACLRLSASHAPHRSMCISNHSTCMPLGMDGSVASPLTAAVGYKFCWGCYFHDFNYLSSQRIKKIVSDSLMFNGKSYWTETFCGFKRLRLILQRRGDCVDGWHQSIHNIVYTSSAPKFCIVMIIPLVD